MASLDVGFLVPCLDGDSLVVSRDGDSLVDSSDCDSLVASSDGVCSLPICARFGGGVSLSSRVSNGVGNLVASKTGTLFSV